LQTWEGSRFKLFAISLNIRMSTGGGRRIESYPSRLNIGDISAEQAIKLTFVGPFSAAGTRSPITR
jgi:hypothetical protein